MRLPYQSGAVVRVVVGICLALLLAPFIIGPFFLSIPHLFRPQKECPACHTPFPKVRLWEDCMQLKWGVWKCFQCGSEVGCNGFMLSWVILALFLVGVGSIIAALLRDVI